MKASYVLSHHSLPAASRSRIDLLVGFQAETTGVRRRALNVSLVIDRSGSMAGAPLKQAIRAAQGVVDRLAPEDRLSVVIYDDKPETLLPPQVLKDKAAIQKVIGKIGAGGCTNLNGGWLQGCAHVEKHHAPALISRVLLLTDGQANVGTTDPKVLIGTAQTKAQAGIATTTLGFGARFNEDLLIGMASAGGGNFYYIESPEDAEGVFQIEVEGLSAVAAQDLQVTLQPAEGVQVLGVLNKYRSAPGPGGKGIEVALGDVYSVEERQLALELEVAAPKKAGPMSLGRLTYSFRTVEDGQLRETKGELPLQAQVVAGKVEMAADPTVEMKTGPLRIARVKDEAVSLADKGDLNEASRRLRQIIDQIKASPIVEVFDIAEEVDQLDHYAQRLEKRSYDGVIRKEMMDQAHQARTRSRSDLRLRGTAGGSASGLEAVSDAAGGIVLRCEKEGGKLRIRVATDGYDGGRNVQFPRALREEGASYVVDTVTPSADGSFYRVGGKIRRLVRPGQERARGAAPARKKTGKASSVSGTAADLPTVSSVGDGVLVQCVKEGSKLRARVVSDGYDPDFNMRFPRTIREEGVLYVVDEVIPGPGGTSYIACGDIKRLVQ